MIYYSLPDSTIQYHQSSDRLHRINSKAGVSIYRMILKGSIDEWAVNLLEYKTKLRDGIIDKKEYAEIETLSYERLLGINKRSIL
jgi:SNF2 family DNA or RNA helicase